MTEICKRLTETYNASILNEADATTQLLFYNYSKANSLGDKGNTVLMNLKIVVK